MSELFFRPANHSESRTRRRSARLCLALALTLALLSPAPCQAQDATSKPTSAAPPQHPAAAEERAFAAAKIYFQRGEALFAAKNYDAALAEFERAYQMLAGHSRQYFVLDHLGMCHEKLFRYDLALEYYRRYLEEGGPDAPSAADVRASIRALEGLVGTLNVKANVSAEAWVDDRRAGQVPGRLVIAGGRHVIELRAPGREAEKQLVTLAAGEEKVVSFELSPLAPPGISPVYFWVGTGLTSAALVTGSVLGFVALRRDAALRDEIDAYGFPADPHAPQAARNMALAADVGLGSAALFGVGTGILYFLTDWGPVQDGTVGRPSVSRDALGAYHLSLQGAF